ncbi:MAG: DUF935 family protein [bacterium]|nr:DUF935 family protein [bacterium]
MKEINETKRPRPGSNYKYDENELMSLNENIGTGVEMQENIHEMFRSDLRLRSVFRTRNLLMLAQDREITGEGAEADFIRDVFKEFNMHTVIDRMMRALHCGYSVTELWWDVKDTKWIIDHLKYRPPARFMFGEKDELRLVVENNEKGKLPEPNKYALISYDGINGQGHGLLDTIYPYYKIKRAAMGDMALFSHSNAIPTPIVKVPEDATPDQIEMAVNLIRQLAVLRGGVLPGGFDLLYKEATKYGSMGVFEGIKGMIDKDYSILVLGQNLLTDSDGGGAYAVSQSQEGVLSARTCADNSMIETCINDSIIKPLIDYNFKSKVYPKFRFKARDEFDIVALATVLEKLAAMGVPVPVSWVTEKYGIPVAKEGEPLLMPAASKGGKLEFSDAAKTVVTQLNPLQTAYVKELQNILAA